MSTELATKIETAPVVAAPQSETAAIISMIERAARDPSVDIEKMERLFQMRERMAASASRTAYLAALAGMQAKLPAAVRRGKGHNGKDYARFEDIIEAIRPIMRRHGFSLTYRTAQDDKSIRVTGVLGHRDGHSETTDMVLPADTSGSKNVVQAWGSSTSYGKRYVSLTLLGIATEREDDDGKAAGDKPGGVTAESLAALIKQSNSNLGGLLSHFSVESLDDLTSKQRDQAAAMIKAKMARAGAK